MRTNILKFREAIGMSQGGLAKELGISQSAVSQLERGETKPSIAVAMKLMKLAKKHRKKFSMKHIYEQEFSNA